MSNQFFRRRPASPRILHQQPRTTTPGLPQPQRHLRRRRPRGSRQLRAHRGSDRHHRVPHRPRLLPVLPERVPPTAKAYRRPASSERSPLYDLWEDLLLVQQDAISPLKSASRSHAGCAAVGKHHDVILLEFFPYRRGRRRPKRNECTAD